MNGQMHCYIEITDYYAIANNRDTANNFQKAHTLNGGKKG